MIVQLDKGLWFPDPRLGEPDGLFAIGGDLSTDRLLLAYSHGIFPWFSFRDADEPYWYCPMKRFVIFPEEIHISHSMRTLLNKDRYQVSMNKDFDSVIAKLCNVSEINYVAEAPAGAFGFIVGSTEFFVPLTGSVDVEAEIKKLEEELKYAQGFLKSVEAKLSNERFVNGAPAAVVDKERKKKADAEAKIAVIEQQLVGLRK